MVSSINRWVSLFPQDISHILVLFFLIFLKICDVANLSVIQNYLEDASNKNKGDTSRFVPRRLIMDNVLATYGCIHKVKKK
jgi:hypothetical protein